MKFESSMGTINSDSEEAPMRVFSVPDGAGYEEPVANNAGRYVAGGTEADFSTGPQKLTPEQLAQIRSNWAQQAKESQQDVDNKFVERVEFLTGISRSKKDFEISLNGKKTTWTLRTLKSKEQKEFASYLQSIKPVIIENQARASHTDMMALRKIALKHSIFQIDFTHITDVLGISTWKKEDRLAAMEVFIEEMDDSFIDYLYGRYQDLVNEHNDKFALKNDKDIKEVAEAVTKSGKGFKA